MLWDWDFRPTIFLSLLSGSAENVELDLGYSRGNYRQTWTWLVYVADTILHHWWDVIEVYFTRQVKAMADVRSRELQVAQRSLQSAQTCLLQVVITLPRWYLARGIYCSVSALFAIHYNGKNLRIEHKRNKKCLSPSTIQVSDGPPM